MANYPRGRVRGRVRVFVLGCLGLVADQRRSTVSAMATKQKKIWLGRTHARATPPPRHMLCNPDIILYFRVSHTGMFATRWVTDANPLGLYSVGRVYMGFTPAGLHPLYCQDLCLSTKIYLILDFLLTSLYIFTKIRVDKGRKSHVHGYGAVLLCVCYRRLFRSDGQ